MGPVLFLTCTDLLDPLIACWLSLTFIVITTYPVYCDCCCYPVYLLTVCYLLYFIMSDSSSPKFIALNNSNYNTWSGNMQAWLMKTGLWRLVSGVDKRPSEAAELSKWLDKAEKASGEIYLCLGEDQKVHVKKHLDDP